MTEITYCVITPLPTKAAISQGATCANSRTEIAVADTTRGGVRAKRGRGKKPYLTAEEYPALAKIWDNEEDDIFDTL